MDELDWQTVGDLPLRSVATPAALGEDGIMAMRSVWYVDDDGRSRYNCILQVGSDPSAAYWVAGGQGVDEVPSTWDELVAILEREPEAAATRTWWPVGNWYGRPPPPYNHDPRWDRHVSQLLAVARLEPEARRVALVLVADGWEASEQDLVLASRACVAPVRRRAAIEEQP